jgi:hypothetical protein
VNFPDRTANPPHQSGENHSISRELGQNGRHQHLGLNVLVLAAIRAFAALPSYFTQNRPTTGALEQPREISWPSIRIPNLGVFLLIVGIWILVAFAINPRGEFPLNDDWTYSRTVKTLLEGGGLKFPEISTNIIAQIYWGALFCLPFGFSFTALRLSTLTLGLIGVLTLYGLLRQADADRKTALFGALLMAFNPLYLVLSYSFMSDVPFVAVALLSLYFIIRGMRYNCRFEIALGLILACLALLIRQTGLAIFLAFGLTYLAKYGIRLRNLVLAGFSVALGGAVQLVWDRYMAYKHILPVHHSLQVGYALSPGSNRPWQFAEFFAHGLFAVFVYLGLFLLPILFFWGRSQLAELFRPRLLTLATLLFTAYGGYWLGFRRMPLMTNVLYDLGLGPPTLRDTFLLGIPSLPSAGRVSWTVATYLGLVCAMVLVQATLVAVAKALSHLPFSTERRESLVLLLASGLIYLAPVTILTAFGKGFDRYLIFLVPMGIAVITIVVSKVDRGTAGTSIRFVAVASLALYAAFSIAGTHDYLSWNRERWQAANDLAKEQGVRANEIDGGYEFNGWYLYDPNYQIVQNKSYWWVDRDDFMITFGPVPGFAEVRRYPYRRWLLPAQSNILVLRRKTPGDLR